VFGDIADARFFFLQAGATRNQRTSSKFIQAKAFKARKLYYTKEVIPLGASVFVY
jgi:hypothetical protein